jgi:hypothetical protein
MASLDPEPLIPAAGGAGAAPVRYAGLVSYVLGDRPIWCGHDADGPPRLEVVVIRLWS